VQYLKQGLNQRNQPELHDTVLSEIIDLIKIESGTADHIDGRSSLVRDLDLDSVEVMELIETFEDKFNVEIPIESLPELETVEDLVRLICPLIQEKKN
jgi:acyl carrier protein